MADSKSKSTAADNTDVKRRLRKLADSKAVKARLEWQITYRFIQEVHLVEKEGRSASRKQLEKDLLLVNNSIGDMRLGRFGVRPSSILRLKEVYNGDFQFVLLGVRNSDVSGPRKGNVKLNVHEGYEFKYRSEDRISELAWGMNEEDQSEEPEPKK